ncbi:copper homeostasis protein [Pedobacter sp. UYP30]|uniref:copper homeostasis protein CutC n=1 Tax=Pedobacter sp. UYP30 TaxID=1756400 RepID=UPI003399B572
MIEKETICDVEKIKEQVQSKSPPNAFKLEVCANSYRSALAAQLGGAARVELCDNLAEGGTTPSYAQIALSKKNLDIEIWPIIRPRGGDFLYTDIEFELILEDTKICKSLRCEGIVTGILKANGEVDEVRMCEVIKLATPMKVAFHRAFDMCLNKEKALEDLIKLGIVRVLSSGGASSAVEGSETLAAMVTQAHGRITIMPGAGVNANNIQELIKKTGATEFHASAKTPVKSEMMFRNTAAKMGTVADEYQYELSSKKLVEKLVGKMNETD